MRHIAHEGHQDDPEVKHDELRYHDAGCGGNIPKDGHQIGQ